jgi:SAM-dependent methyltransferase
MDQSTYHRDHWVHIEPERLAVSDQLYDWPEPIVAMVLDRLDAKPGQVVVDLGCGPGYVTRAIARRVGESGHVHGVELNLDFVHRARAIAETSGVDRWTTIHHVTDDRIPLEDQTVDRVLAKNVLEYVPDLTATLADMKRVLRPGGRATAVDSDWGFLVIEPLTPDEVREVFTAAAPAFKEPYVGRKLRGEFVAVGFSDVTVEVQVLQDEQGGFRGIIESMLGYAQTFERISKARAADVLGCLDEAIAEGTYLAIVPQFVVSGTAP